jgi:hypothetical protein
VGPGIVPPPVVSPTDWRKSAFDLAADSTKQLITVATGVVAATGLLSKDLEGWARWFAGLSWGAYVLSVLCGLFVLYNMSGTLFDSARNWGTPRSLRKGDHRLFHRSARVVSGGNPLDGAGLRDEKFRQRSCPDSADYRKSLPCSTGAASSAQR